LLLISAVVFLTSNLIIALTI
jgi:hypothetical protein